MLAIQSMLARDRRRHHFSAECARSQRLFLPNALLALLLIFQAQRSWAENVPEVQAAAAFDLPQLPKMPSLPSLTGPSASWQQFDSFFKFVVKRFGDDVPANLKDSLTEAFLDSRYDLTNAVAPGKGGNPVPPLFSNSWKGLSPIINQSLPSLPKQTAGLYSSFIGAANKLVGAGGTGLNLTPDALKAMARMIAPTGTADPLAYSTTFTKRELQ